MIFPCTGCGLCCRGIAETIQLAKSAVEMGTASAATKEIADFPHKTKPDGSCEHLQADHSCGIYATRPDICSVKTTYLKHHNANISMKKYFSQTAEICNTFITEAGLDDKYLVNLNP